MLTNEGGFQSLLIPYTVPTDGGVYECIARNKAGEASFTVQLDVEGKYLVLMIIACSARSALSSVKDPF